VRVVDNRRSQTATPAPVPAAPNTPPGTASWRLTPDLVRRLTVAYNHGQVWDHRPHRLIDEDGLRALLLAMSRCGLLARPFDPET